MFCDFVFTWKREDPFVIFEYVSVIFFILMLQVIRLPLLAALHMRAWNWLFINKSVGGPGAMRITCTPLVHLGTHTILNDKEYCHLSRVHKTIVKYITNTCSNHIIFFSNFTSWILTEAFSCYPELIYEIFISCLWMCHNSPI